ncbi:hypothetical protein [Haloarcula amylovorans]|uniref:hypothetical protein n=1 Tax=Haloarcula amylovorans TaxID=2562280 RepID=UPI00107636EB|nr:hypothetical protein [Halomicroarcula amylolytica]
MILGSIGGLNCLVVGVEPCPSLERRWRVRSERFDFPALFRCFDGIPPRLLDIVELGLFNSL